MFDRPVGAGAEVQTPTWAGPRSVPPRLTQVSVACSFQGGVKVLITGPWQEASNNYSCLFDQISVPASLIQPGVLRCYCPGEDAFRGGPAGPGSSGPGEGLGRPWARLASPAVKKWVSDRLHVTCPGPWTPDQRGTRPCSAGVRNGEQTREAIGHVGTARTGHGGRL